MRIIRSVPVYALRKALFALLKAGQDRPIYGALPKSTPSPFITIGAATFKPIGTKSGVLWRATTQIHIWADYGHLAALNETMNDIAVILTAYGNRLNVDKFAVIDCDIDFLETYEEESAGYHGVITVVIDLEKEE